MEDLIEVLKASMHTNLIIVNEGTVTKPDYVIRGGDLVVKTMRMAFKEFERKKAKEAMATTLAFAKLLKRAKNR